MRYFAWDDAHLGNALEPEFAFTETYRAHAGDGIAAREAACLAVCLPASALPPEPGDWFVGRRKYRPLGVSPSYWNDETDGLDHVSYYADLDRLARVMDRPDQTPENRAAIAGLIDFWKDENVNAKVRARFDPELAKQMPSDRWTRDSGVIFGLYRLAGAQLDYDKLVLQGLPGLRRELERLLAAGDCDEKQQDFLTAELSLISTLTGLLASYEAQLRALAEGAGEADRERWLSMAACAARLQREKPACFQDAVQLVWLYSAFSGTLDFGRMDEYLGDWYVHDMDAGLLTHERAMELLLSFYRLMRQIHNRDTRLILGGLGRRNPENADRFALIAMEASAKHGEMQPQVSLRMYKGMDPAVRRAGLDFLQLGMSYPLLYNDEASVAAVMKGMRVSREEAEQYAFFGCGEYVLNRMSMGTPNDIINLAKALEVTLHGGRDPVDGKEHGLDLGAPEDFDTFEKLLAAYKKQVEYFTELAARHQRLVYDTVRDSGAMLMMSLLLKDCVARGRAAIDGGIRYLAGTYETYGNITAADSLTAIRSLVYEQKLLSLRELREILDRDFEGAEEWRAKLLACPKFGNDDPAADGMAGEIDRHIFEFTAAQAEKQGLSSYLVVMINNDANVVLGRKTLATADGRRAYTYLSNGNGPMAGMDRSGLTSLIRSMASTDMSLTAGTAQNLKLSRDLFVRHRDELNDLIDAAWDLGILSLNVSVMNPGDMEDAMAHPEKYPNLFVRVGGFSARFTELDPGTQQDVLHRTMY